MPQPESYEQLLDLLARRDARQWDEMNAAYQHAYRYYGVFSTGICLVLFLVLSWLSYMAERPRPLSLGAYQRLNPTLDIATVYSPSTEVSNERAHNDVAVACGHRYYAPVENTVRVDADRYRIRRY